MPMPNFSVSLAPSRLDQVINPWTWNLFTINLGRSSDPTVEQRVLDEVGSYGLQLGQIGDVVGVLVSMIPDATLKALPERQRAAIDKLNKQLDHVAQIKEQEGRDGLRTGAGAKVGDITT
jgi:hypothetical protein